MEMSILVRNEFIDLLTGIQKYNYERAKCEDIKIIREDFDRVRDVIQEYEILSEDMPLRNC
ncbi:hypothetical protein TSTA_017070 [Talaromyces stipitatus ATCC 10500]|uniref:Uncharacterized protein n=1 Tax=Talaromyces stipitatus (strain ATCC 10500 / CBS 375.48 / QM 6759 / NRRL 1006) TaxID=441959 RepID=B8MEK5_TALSN|nr:uncharacterized protein TSTA_017070 [Talaromyces stipitatus ATCC 10500]EED16632.1 hypothetical protein TSTA_017070 [Talaromyces stipitatus ATCC 10500]